MHKPLNNIVILVLSFYLCLQINYAEAKNNCTRDARELSNAQGLFVHCANLAANATAFQLCRDCVRQFDATHSFYQQFLLDCPDYYGQNAVTPIPILQNGISNLWQKAYCADCVIDNKLFEFDNLTTAFNNCAHEYPKTLCHSCLVAYDELNEFYTNIDRTNKGKVCYDLHFAMNATRTIWSANCQHEASLFYFTLATALISCIPIIFYAVNIFLVKRLERRHELLYNRDAEEREPEITTPSPALESQQPVIEEVLSAESSKVSNIINLSDDESDDESEDANLLLVKSALPKKIQQKQNNS